MRKFLMLILVLLITGAVNGAGLKGTYSIDPAGSGSTNFKSFRAAIMAMRKNGLRGHVIFNIADGVYNEQLYIPTIKGSSRARTVTFQSKSLDSTKVTIDTAGGDQTILFSGAGYMTFRKLTISHTCNVGTVTGDVCQFSANEHLTFENNILRYNKGGTVPYHEGVIDMDYPNNDYIIIRNNHVIGAYWGVEHDPGSNEVGNEISGNIIDSVEHCGINMHYQTGMFIYNNKINMQFKSSIGMWVTNGTKDGDHGASYIYNNFVTVSSGNCLQLANNDGLNIYYNTLVNESSDNTVTLANTAIPASTNFANNVAANFGGGMVLQVTMPGKMRIDFNDLYTTGTTLGEWKLTTAATLSDWKKASGKDYNSVSGDPLLTSVSTGDLHATSSSFIINNDATPISGFKYDIDGQSRSHSTPDIGADEFNANTDDIGVTAIYIPKGVTCGRSSIDVKVKIHNFGSNSQTNNFRIYAQVSGGASALVYQNFKGTLNAGQDSILSVNFYPAINTSKGGIFNFTIFTVLPGDINNSNDTMTSSDSFYASPEAKFIVSYFNCLNDSVKFTNLSTGAVSQIWSFGDGKSSTSANPEHLYSATGNYSVLLKVSTSNGCMDSTHTSIRLDSCFNEIFGKIKTSTGSELKNSRVYAVRYDSADTSINIIGRTKTDSRGYYDFNHIADSVVYLVAFPDSSKYPKEVVTWRDTTLVFQHAKAVRAIAPSYVNVDFHTLSGKNNSGKGIVSGKLYLCNVCKKSGGTPAAGIKLILVDNDGICQGMTYTDADGNFSFGDLAITDYHIWVDKPMVDNFSSPKISLSGDKTNLENLVLTLYPTLLTMDQSTVTGVENNIDANDNAIKIYPNPFQSVANISYSLDKTTRVTIEIYDLTGRRIATLVDASQSEGNYNAQFNASEYESAKPGMYLVRMMIGNSLTTKSIILQGK